MSSQRPSDSDLRDAGAALDSIVPGSASVYRPSAHFALPGLNAGVVAEAIRIIADQRNQSVQVTVQRDHDSSVVIVEAVS